MESPHAGDKGENDGGENSASSSSSSSTESDTTTGNYTEATSYSPFADENRRILRTRMFVLYAIGAAAASCTLATYFIAKHWEENEFMSEVSRHIAYLIALTM